MTGSADKSNKANLVVLLKRDREIDGNYGNTVHVQVDKIRWAQPAHSTSTCSLEYFRLTDIYRERL